MAKPLVLQESFKRVGFYSLRHWVHDNDKAALALYCVRYRPFVGCNPALERVTDG